jgi:hypothetical protein
MNKLIVFGCSFTAGDGCYENQPYPKKYKKFEDDLIWPEYVAKKLNLKLFNFGMGGVGNDIIIDSIISNYDLIGEGDVVVIEKTFSHRFDLSLKINNQHQWKTITPTSYDTLKEIGYTNDEVNSFLYTLSLTDTELQNKRYLDRLNFLKKILISDKKVNNCIIWDIESGYHIKWERIVHVDNTINDGHWSYEGHRLFANEIIEKIKNNE